MGNRTTFILGAALPAEDNDRHTGADHEHTTKHRFDGGALG
jgi:hypothetical protein